jgi:pSer/pThr/pTyr-binding forkhead associated (FHA) protein
MACLVLNQDGADLVVHELSGEIITIGRVALNHVAIDNPTVSAQHALLARLGDSYRLKDLHSTNGTWVNGVAITDSELNNGDKIRFGSIVGVFVRSVR